MVSHLSGGSGARRHVVAAALVTLSLATATVRAQETAAPREAPPSSEATASEAATGPLAHVRFGVALEGYYQFNWNRPYDRVNPLRAYDTRANVFSLQQAALVVEREPDPAAGRRAGARVDLQFGQATETVQGNPSNEPRPDAFRHVWQAYGSYVFPVGRGLRADFGKFASNLGFETNYAKDNHHFSRAYLFNFLPFYHSGLRLTSPVADRLTVLYMLTNGIQQTEDFNDFKSHHVTAIVTPGRGVTWTTSYYAGQEQPDGGAPDAPDGVFRVVDTYLTYAPSPALSLGLDVNYTTNEVRRADESLSLQGTGVYARYQLREPVALALRYERLDDEGLFGGRRQRLHEVTATAEYAFADGFLMRGEFRRDWSDAAIFTGARDDIRHRRQTTALVGLVWWFGNKQGTW